MKTDSAFAEIEREVRRLEKEFDLKKREVADLESRIAGLKASFKGAEIVQRAEGELDRARTSLAETHEKLKEAWAARDALIAKKPSERA